MKKVLTDTLLRANWSAKRNETLWIEAGVFVTPAAKDFLKEHNIELKSLAKIDNPLGFSFDNPNTMTRIKPPMENGKALFQDAITGEKLLEKPENMTHLFKNQLVPKTYPVIAFRGKLDSLQAKILEVQLNAKDNEKIVKQLTEILLFVRQIMSAEVNQKPLEITSLLDMTFDEIHEKSHKVSHPVPHYSYGRLFVDLNLLRTNVRELELLACSCLFDRKDIIEALNRLSSLFYLLMCENLSK